MTMRYDRFVMHSLKARQYVYPATCAGPSITVRDGGCMLTYAIEAVSTSG